MLLYIDPGTGSMLFTILIGLLGAAFYFIRGLIVKIRFAMSGGRQDITSDRIPIVLFSDHKRYWNVFEPLCDELEARGVEAVYMTASEDDPALSRDYKHVRTEFIGNGNRAYSKLNLLRARVLVATTPQLDVLQWKRSREVDYYIHILHAAPDAAMYRIFGLDYYDAVLLSGEYQAEQIRELERLRKLPAKELEYIGIPYMDKMKERIFADNDTDKPKEEKHERTILLAPSWGPSGILRRYGSKLIDVLADTGYRIIIRPHPQSYTAEKDVLEKLKNRYADYDNITWNSDNDNFEVLKKSDMLISDFSGIIFDYALVFDKPVIYTQPDNFDKSPYDCFWLEKEMWTFEALPRIGIELKETDIGDIGKVIDECVDDPRYAAARSEARSETWMYPGEGATRAVDYIMNTYQRLSAS